MNMVYELTRVLQGDAKALEILRSHEVKPEGYVAFVFDNELRKARHIGAGVGFLLTVGLFLISFFAAAGSVSDARGQWLFGFGGGLLGLIITWGTMRHMAGKRWKYLDQPDETASGFQLLGMVNRLDAKHMARLNEKAWAQLKAYKLDLNAKRYQRLPTEPKTEREKAVVMKMSPTKKRLVECLERIQRWCAWLILGGVLALVSPGLFFVWWAWFFAGLWLTLECFMGIIKRQIGVFSETNVIDLYGWPARAFAWFMLAIALAIFVVPGALGMWEAIAKLFLR